MTTPPPCTRCADPRSRCGASTRWPGPGPTSSPRSSRPATSVDALQHGGADARDDLRQPRRVGGGRCSTSSPRWRRRSPIDPTRVRASIAATLDAASLDASLQDDLLRGRLTAELAPAVRFLGDVGDADDAGDARPRRDARPAPPSARRRRHRCATTSRRVGPRPRSPRPATAPRSSATRCARPRRDSRDAQQRLDDAHRRVAELESRSPTRAPSVADAKRAVTEASRAETRVRTAQRRAEAALRVAERNASP